MNASFSKVNFYCRNPTLRFLLLFSIKSLTNIFAGQILGFISKNDTNSSSETSLALGTSNWHRTSIPVLFLMNQTMPSVVVEGSMQKTTKYRFSSTTLILPLSPETLQNLFWHLHQAYELQLVSQKHHQQCLESQQKSLISVTVTMGFFVLDVALGASLTFAALVRIIDSTSGGFLLRAAETGWNRTTTYFITV
jgi:hypothetical protein